LSKRMSTPESIGWMMKGIEQSPIKVGANRFTDAN